MPRSRTKTCALCHHWVPWVVLRFCPAGVSFTRIDVFWVPPSFLGTSGCLIGALITHQSFRNVYDNEYLPVALNDLESPEALFQYNRANQRYKLQQFFLFAAVGVWAYSLIDSYVGANLYNAEAKANQLIDDMKRLEELGVQFEVTPAQLQLGIVKFF